MNSKSSSFDVDSLRETLGYSIQFLGKLFCVIIDAESFERYNCNQLVQDLLLVVDSCDAKIIVITGCFPSRLRKKKRAANLERIQRASEAITKRFGHLATTIKLSGEWQKSLPEQLNIVLKRQSVAIVPAVQESLGMPDLKQILSSLGGAVGQDQIAKLIILSSCDGVVNQNGDFLHQVQSDHAQDLINKDVVSGELAVILQTALLAVSNNIRRVHIVNGVKPGALLEELFTKDGTGTMIYSGQYIGIRPAWPEDINGIRSLMSVNAIQNSPVRCCESNVEQFWVAAIDDYAIACARLRHFAEEKKSLISSLTVNPDYPDIGIQLLAKTTDVACSKGYSSILLVLPKIIPWWMPPAFKTVESSALPLSIQEECQGELKSSTILSKDISS
jgi:N-acetylglutamate synthase-like GNAT family acetyltransferase